MAEDTSSGHWQSHWQMYEVILVLLLLDGLPHFSWQNNLNSRSTYTEICFKSQSAYVCVFQAQLLSQHGREVLNVLRGALFYSRHFDLSGKAQVLLMTLTMALFYSSVPVMHDSVTVSQHAQHQDRKTWATKWNSAIIHFIIYTCALPSVTCQTVRKKAYNVKFEHLQFKLSTSADEADVWCGGKLWNMLVL